MAGHQAPVHRQARSLIPLGRSFPDREAIQVRSFTSYDEIESLCQAMIRDFFRSRHNTSGLCVDIEAFVKDYLGLQIVYESFAEQDPGRFGFLSDGIRPLLVWRGITWRVTERLTKSSRLLLSLTPPWAT